jgi:hypothetical protein
MTHVQGHITNQSFLYYSFMFMSVLPGRHLESQLALSVPKPQQAKIAGQLAEILHQLNKNDV